MRAMPSTPTPYACVRYATLPCQRATDGEGEIRAMNLLRSSAARSWGLWLCLSACSNQNHEKPAAASPAVEGLTDPSHPATPAQRLLQDYLRLQTKLAADDAAGA